MIFHLWGKVLVVEEIIHQGHVNSVKVGKWRLSSSNIDLAEILNFYYLWYLKVKHYIENSEAKKKEKTITIHFYEKSSEHSQTTKITLHEIFSPTDIEVFFLFLRSGLAGSFRAPAKELVRVEQSSIVIVQILHWWQQT